MSDYYTEQLVKQKTKASSVIAKIALIAVTVLSFFSCTAVSDGDDSSGYNGCFGYRLIQAL